MGGAFTEQGKVKRVLLIYFEMALSLSFLYNVLIGITPGLAWEKICCCPRGKKFVTCKPLGMGWKSSLETANGSPFNFKWDGNKSEAESDSMNPRPKKEPLGLHAFNQHHRVAWADTCRMCCFVMCSLVK